MAWICVCCRTENAAYRRKCSNSECRFPGGPPEAWDEKRAKGKRKDKQHLPKHTWHCDGCGEENSSRRWSCSSCGAKPPESGAFSAAVQPKKRPVSERQIFAEAVAQERHRVQAALPMESRSQPDGEVADVKIDEDSSQDRDRGNSKEVANKLKDLDTLIRQLQPCAKDDGVAALLEEKKQERDELKIRLQNHKPLHQRLRLAKEERAKASKALEVAKREEADIVELLALKRAEVDQLKATLPQHNNNFELLELRYRTQTGSAYLCHFESPGVQTVTAPLSPIQWAAGFRNCLNAEARDVFDAFYGELEKSPDSEGGLPDETPFPAPAHFHASPPVNAGAFAPFPKPRPTRVDTYQTPTPALGAPQSPCLQAHPYWYTTMAGAVDMPVPFQFATSGDACPRSMDTAVARDSEDAQSGLPVPSCSENPSNSMSGAQVTPPVAKFLSHVPAPRGATAASLRNALCLGDNTLGMLCKDIPEGALDEVCEWGYADDEEAFTSILIFTDGSGTMTDSWLPQPRDAVLGTTETH